MNELALFAGAGGGILGGHLLGWRCVCAVEFNAYVRSVLLARQNDGTLPAFPIWDDVRTFDGRPWRGLVDVVSGGFPCQDISAAGKGDGLDGERSGLWSEMARIIGEVRPRFAFVENSPMLTSRGLGRVLGDLAALGFDAEWGVLGAADVGAPHKRDRIWIIANARIDRRGEREIQHIAGEPEQASDSRLDGEKELVADANCLRELQPARCERHERDGACQCCEAVADASSKGLSEPWAQPDGAHREQRRRVSASNRGWPAEPGLGRMAHELADRLDFPGTVKCGECK